LDSPLSGLASSLRRPKLTRRTVMISVVLSIIFSVAVLMRAYAARYGFFLNEFDPYYDYYAASHIVTLAQQHGLYYALFNNPAGCGTSVLTTCHNQQGYFYWHDIQTWFPYGRNVALTSQDGLQIGGAVLYLLVSGLFGVNITLYNFLVLLPVFLGAVTAVMFYFLVKKIAGDAAGLFSALMFAVSPPLIERGNLGWFKSEPLSIFLFVGASILILTVFDKERSVSSRLGRAVLAGLLAGYANTAWGGGIYFSATFGLLFILIPFLNFDLAGIWTSIVAFSAATLFASAIFPRPGVDIVTNPAGLALITGTLFIIVAQWSRGWVKPADYRGTLVKFLFGFALAGLAVLSFGLVGGVTTRYLAAIAPWVRTGKPLVESVAEHFVPTGQDYFTSYIILLAFGAAGAIIAFRKMNLTTLFALVFGLTGLYVSAAFSRLLVFSSIALGLLAGIGFAEFALAVVKPASNPLVKKKQASGTRNEMKVVFSVAVIALIVIPAGTYWIPNPIPCTAANTYFCDQSPADSAVSLANGATTYSRSTSNDWTQTLQWIRQNTPTNSVVISWWDYGYWIAVMGNRTTAADNATINGTRIGQIGRMFMSNVTQAAKIADQISQGQPTYVALFITGSILQVSSSQQYYILQVPAGNGFAPGGGDESKKQWFIRIGGLNETSFLECPKVTKACAATDDFNLTPNTVDNTLFGKLLPFQSAGYLLAQNQQGSLSITDVPTYQFGSSPVGLFYNLPITNAFTYPATPTFGPSSTGPFRLAYASPSLTTPYACPGNSGVQCFSTILVYQVTG
jgi:dolichyl-diphosphooligosaccharide---protein glycosyltransferase